MSRPRLLFYCQHLLGIGHISRSLALCRALADRFDVTYLQGGPDIGRTLDHPAFDHVFLPPLLMREHDSTLYDPAGAHSVETLWQMRQDAVAPVLDEPYDAVVIELFPFGRNKFKREILGIIDAARQKNPAVQVFCSNRDIMVQKNDQAAREEKILRVLESHFDYLLVHTDPALIPMEATFAATPRIADKIRYTGYVADGVGPAAASAPARGPGILVSLGGGAVGDELALAAIAVADAFPEHPMTVLTGPYTTDAGRKAFQEAAAGKPGVTIKGFSEDFRADLAAARLSISLAGYNTLMDLLATRTPALVYPYMANIEQNMRATALQDLGLVGIVTKDMLAPDRLIAAIRARLDAPPAAQTIDLSGAESTAAIIEQAVATARP